MHLLGVILLFGGDKHLLKGLLQNFRIIIPPYYRSLDLAASGPPRYLRAEVFLESRPNFMAEIKI